MLKSAGTSNLECTQHAVPGRKSLLACALLAMLAGNQAMADLLTNSGTIGNPGDTQLIIDDAASGNSVSINGATPEVNLNSGAGTTVISTENSSFTGNLSVSGDTTATTISATNITANSVTANSVTASLNAAGTVVPNVGDGVADSDAVNVSQLNASQSTSGAALNSYANEVDARFGSVDSRFNAVDSRFNAVDRRIDKVEEVANAGVASVAALAAIPSPAYGKRFSVGAGLGNYASESAVAVGFRAALTESTSVTAGVSRNTASKTAANLGVGYSW